MNALETYRASRKATHAPATTSAAPDPAGTSGREADRTPMNTAERKATGKGL
jgi:hypothetical protein